MKITKEQLKNIIKESIQDYMDAYYPKNSYRDVLIDFCRDAHETLYDEQLPEEDISTTSTYDLKKMAEEYEKELKDSNLLEGDMAKELKAFYPDDYSEHDALFSYYSDIFKDLNGFRPRPNNKPSLEELEDMVKNVELELKRKMAEEQKQETVYEDTIAGGTGGLSPISGGPVLAEEEMTGDFEEGYAKGMEESAETLKVLSEKVNDEKIARMLMNLARNFEGKSTKAKAKSFQLKNKAKRF